MLKQINYVFGEFIEHPLNISDMEVIFKQARNKLKKIYYLPVYRIIDSIDKVLNLWKDENSFYYKETLKLMPDIVGFSDKMIKLAIDELIKNFIKENLVKRLDVELKDLNLLDKWLYDNKSNVFLRVNPIGVLVHITAGNVFVSAIGRKPNLPLDLITKKEINFDNYLRLKGLKKLIFALGDVTGLKMLAHKAEYQAKIVAKNIITYLSQNKLNYEYNLNIESLIPGVVFTIPQVAFYGLTIFILFYF